MHLPLACKAAIPKRETLRPIRLRQGLRVLKKSRFQAAARKFSPSCKGKEENGYDICSDDPDLGDGQYTNDDMANLTALKTAAGVFAESYQFGLGLLEQALDR